MFKELAKRLGFLPPQDARGTLVHLHAHALPVHAPAEELGLGVALLCGPCEGLQAHEVLLHLAELDPHLELRLGVPGRGRSVLLRPGALLREEGGRVQLLDPGQGLQLQGRLRLPGVLGGGGFGGLHSRVLLAAGVLGRQ